MLDENSPEQFSEKIASTISRGEKANKIEKILWKSALTSSIFSTGFYLLNPYTTYTQIKEAIISYFY